MKYTKFITIFLMFFFFSYQKAYSQDWFGKIIPLQTTKEDVEKIIPISPSEKSKSGNTYTYFLKDWTVIIDFSPGRCVSEKYEKWNIEEGVVMNVFYTATNNPEEWVKLSVIEKNMSGFKKEKRSEHTYYTDLERGIIYTTHAGRVRSFTYFIPPNKQDYLRCKS